VEVEKLVEKLLNEGVVEESNSPWNSPVLVVAKKMDANGKKEVQACSRLPETKRENRISLRF
jgi:hypothetical protein